jgi:hypothetical protein
MPFVVPQFPLECNIFTAHNIAAPPRLTEECNLAWGHRVAMPAIGATADNSYLGFPGTMTLLLPALTDIRDAFNASSYDSVECPAGSGRYYDVLYVDDIGKGFANEHRGAVIQKIQGGLIAWPTPIP